MIQSLLRASNQPHSSESNQRIVVELPHDEVARNSEIRVDGRQDGPAKPTNSAVAVVDVVDIAIVDARNSIVAHSSKDIQ